MNTPELQHWFDRGVADGSAAGAVSVPDGPQAAEDLCNERWYHAGHDLRHAASEYTAKIMETLCERVTTLNTELDRTAGGLAVLDVGCGHGDYTREMLARLAGTVPFASVTGIELDAEMATECKAKGFGGGRENFVFTGDFDAFLANGKAKTACPDKFDAIIFVHSIHLMDVEPTIKAAVALLNPGGKVFLGIQGQDGVPALYERYLPGKKWAWGTAEAVMAKMDAASIPHTPYKFPCKIDGTKVKAGEEVKLLCDFMFALNTASFQPAMGNEVVKGVNEEMMVIEVKAA